MTFNWTLVVDYDNDQSGGLKFSSVAGNDEAADIIQGVSGDDADVNIYFVSNIDDSSGKVGFSLKFQPYIFIEQDASDETVAHEVGHWAGIAGDAEEENHSLRAGDLMFSPSSSWHIRRYDWNTANP